MRCNLSRIVHYLYKTKKSPTGTMSTFSSADMGNPKNKKMIYNSYFKITLGAVTCSFIWLYAEMLKDNEVGAVRPDLPFYCREEITKHNSIKTHIWVTYRQGVYDITDYIESHPAGNIILKAAGSAVDPFWKVYKSHNQDYVKELLESYRIGNVDVKGETKNVYYDPNKNPSDKPIPLGVAAAAGTPKKMVHVYAPPKGNPAHPPSINPESYKLVVVQGENSKSFSLEELKEMPRSTVNATILCAAKKSSDKKPQLQEANRGICWSQAAIDHAQWSGVKLSTVLKNAGVMNQRNSSYVKFESVADLVTNNHNLSTISLLDALDENGDMLLAYEMNGKELTSNNGFPLRVIIPGINGAKNIKWLNKIVVAEDIIKLQSENDGVLCPESGLVISKKSTDADKETKSPLCLPSDGDTVVINPDNTVNLKGYAWSGGGRGIVSVDLTCDQGATWHKAIITPKEISDTSNPEKKDTEKSETIVENTDWTAWEAKVPLPQAELFQTEIWVKAIDSSYNLQKTLMETLYEEIKLLFKID